MRLQATCLLALALCQVAAASNLPRQESTTTTTSATTPPPPTSTTTSGTTTTTSATTETTPTSTTTTETTETTPTTTATTTDPPKTTATTPNTPPPSGTTTFLTTESDGDVATVVLTQTGTSTSSSASASSTSNSDNSDDGGGIGTGAIVGMSVAGGLALIGIVAFFIWKFTRKRSSFDDNEAIKWPDLNSHNAADTGVAAVPAHTTGRSGGFDSQSETTGSLMHADNYSTADFSTNDPYAVPPLPHLNPNQPYRDDPTAAGGYYDPYRGPVPGTLDHGTGDWHGEAIPMQQIQHQQTGGPIPGYDQVGFEQPGYNNAGRASPGPHAAFAGEQLGRTGSPAPMAPPYQQGGYDGYDGSMPPPQAGRQSPGPQQAYGGRMSPGPNMAYNNTGYGQGPAPGYDAYGPR